ncbi:putative c6 transcription factor [Diplodia seriata]|uniref:Putative c6 transcription factor n=1 Tax=Diplodia seriata TaxID=420778 RepID=A0A0G2E258_9PEZI|nr:putative c6 transcription factor [Diplodia seriata]
MGDSALSPLDNVRPPKRQKSMTVIACNSCKRRKSKCNGVRPACDRCLRLNEECHYELDSNISRQDGLKRRLREVTAKSESLEAVVSQLRSASDLEAADLIRQLRQGADAHELVERTSAPSRSRLSSVAEEDNHQSYPSPPVEDPGSKMPLLSWMINPTAETYAKMPDLIKPTPMQMMVPHISPLDTVPLYVCD